MNKYQNLVFVICTLFFFSNSVYSQENQEIINDAPVPQSFERILFVEVSGSQRIEPDTIRSYMTIGPGDLYNEEVVDTLKVRSLY